MTELHRAYGGALYELSRDEGIEREMLAELGAVSSIIRENPDFVKLMNLASVPEEERLKSLDVCFRGRVQPYLLNFLKLIAERGSFGELPGCLAAFEERYNRIRRGCERETAFREGDRPDKGKARKALRKKGRSHQERGPDPFGRRSSHNGGQAVRRKRPEKT